jgi:hypothetical protein
MNDNDAKYAFLFLTNDDLDLIWVNDSSQYILFRVYCVDSLYGREKFYEKDYRVNRTVIVGSDFVFGDSIDIQK